MCGEGAADPMLIPLLISFGLDEYSVTPTSVLSTRREISQWTKEKANETAKKVMAIDTERHVVNQLEKMVQK